MESLDSRAQIDCEELAAFLVDKSERLGVDKDFVVAMDRLIQFAQHMRQRERMAQVLTPTAPVRCACTVTLPPQDLASVLADSNGVISSQHMHWFFEAEGSRECVCRCCCCLCAPCLCCVLRREADAAGQVRRRRQAEAADAHAGHKRRRSGARCPPHDAWPAASRAIVLQVDRDELVVFILRKAHDASDKDYSEGISHLKKFALSMKRQEDQGTAV